MQNTQYYLFFFKVAIISTNSGGNFSRARYLKRKGTGLARAGQYAFAPKGRPPLAGGSLVRQSAPRADARTHTCASSGYSLVRYIRRRRFESSLSGIHVTNFRWTRSSIISLKMSTALQW